VNKSSINILLYENVSADKIESVLHRSALEAFQVGWTYMETSFQLGGRAADLGMEQSRVEHVLRSAFEIERRKEVRDDDSSDPKESATVTGQAIYLHPHEQRSTYYSKKESARLLNVEAVSLPWPEENWRLDLKKLLTSLFSPEESFAINRSLTGRSSIQKVKDALKADVDFVKTIRFLDGDSGAWLRVNPTLGDRESDLSSYRYVLIQNTSLELGKQLAYFRALNLPCAALVNCCGETIQAWVKIDANNSEEYEKRVCFLVETLKSSGFEVNSFEGDPLALAALPGILIQGKQQYLLDLQSGAESWEEWNLWAEAYLDGNPLIEEAASYSEAPMRSLEVIAGLIRTTHRLVLSGPTGSGKSFAAIDMAIAVSQGEPYLGLETEKSKVLFVNMESDPVHLVNRFFDVARARDIKTTFENIDYLHLLGIEKNIAELGDLLVKRVKAASQWEGKEYSIIIVDGAGKIPGSLKRTITPAGDSISLSMSLDKVVALTGSSIVVLLKDTEAKNQSLNVDSHLRIEPKEHTTSFSFRSRHYSSGPLTNKVWEYPIFK
jgi:hypothetical protein